jgi:hypothetical protein
LAATGGPPNQTRSIPSLSATGGQQRNDDEHDLEEIEEDRHHEDER